MMENLRMVDLHGQYLNIKNEIDVAIQDVIDSTAFINGPHVKEFRKELAEYLEAKHVISCGNGTDALQIALMALGLKPGDEVIAPDFTFIATAEVIALLGLKPVFVDVDPITFTIDTEKLKKAITPKTKAIIPVHLYGQCANMNELMQLADEHQLAIVEDTAQAIGSEYNLRGTWRKAATMAHIGCLSFFPSKNLGCYGDGGALVVQDDELAEQVQCIANHGAKVKYYHPKVGVNSRLDTMQAAILRVKLRKLNEYTDARRKAAKYYDDKLTGISGIELPKTDENSTHVYHQYTLKTENRDELQKFLKEKGIPSMIYYPVPMHRQEPYKVYGDFTVSEQLCSSVLSIPMHTELTSEQQDYICTSIREFYN